MESFGSSNPSAPGIMVVVVVVVVAAAAAAAAELVVSQCQIRAREAHDYKNVLLKISTIILLVSPSLLCLTVSIPSSLPI